jgi:phosphoribosylcarboxyaminoimidazole (NCAIR) mutase
MSDWEAMKQAVQELKKLAITLKRPIIMAQQLPSRSRPLTQQEHDLLIIDYIDVGPRRK